MKLRFPLIALLAWALDFALMYAQASFWPGQSWLGWGVTAGCLLLSLSVVRHAVCSTAGTGDGTGETCQLARDLAIITAALATIAIVWHGIAVL
jgi:hypothetical protein